VTLDITYACTFWAVKRGVPPSASSVVAAGLLVRPALRAAGHPRRSGWRCIISSRSRCRGLLPGVPGRWPLLWQRPVVCGAAYGLLLYAS